MNISADNFKDLNYEEKIFMPLLGAVVLGMSAYAGYRTYDAYNGVNESDLLLANAEALADPDEGNILWFSNLRNVECTLIKVNGAGAFYYKGVFVPAGGSYTYYGSKWRCEREITVNTCNTSNETSCK